MKKKSVFIISAGVVIIGSLLFAWQGLLASTDEAVKLIQMKDSLTNQWEKINYLNSISDIVVWSSTNKNKDIISKLKDKIYLNRDLSYASNPDADTNTILLAGWDMTTSIGSNFINGINTYYDESQVAPKDPTSVLPIPTPCQVYNMENPWLYFKGTTNSYSSLGNYDSTSVKSDFSSFVQPGNILDWYLWLKVYLSNKNVTGVPTVFELTNENNAKGFTVNNLCAYNTSGSGCTNWLNTFKIPASGVLNNSASTDWSNLKWIEMYSSTGVSVSVWNDFFLLNQIGYSTSIDPGTMIIVNDFKNTPNTLSGYAPIASRFYDCKTYLSTDTTPLFVSYYQNGNGRYDGWYTIVELRNRSDETYVNRFYIGNSKKGETYVRPAANKSYTYGIYQQQDRSNLFYSNAGGNINLIDWVKTLSYSGLNLGEYSVYMRNINRFGYQSSNILVGYLKIIPPANLDFDFINVQNPANSVVYSIVNHQADINFDKNIKINLKNTNGYDYDIFVNATVSAKNATSFTIDSLPNGPTPVAIAIKDNAGNLLDTKSIIINVDTIAPVIQNIAVNKVDYNGVTNTDSTIAMLDNLGLTNVNDNIFWLGDKRVPFVATAIDNQPLSSSVLQYATTAWGPYSNIVNQIISGNTIKWNVDASFIAQDGQTTLHFRVVDKAGNVSQSKPVVYVTNRIATSPLIVTNNGNDVITNSEKISVSLQLDPDTIYLLVNGNKISGYTRFSNIYTFDLPLTLWENVFSLQAVDLLLNESTPVLFKITKTPTPLEWVAGKDKTINFKWGVRANSINLQRVTPNGDPGEIFSK